MDPYLAQRRKKKNTTHHIKIRPFVSLQFVPPYVNTRAYLQPQFNHPPPLAASQERTPPYVYLGTRDNTHTHTHTRTHAMPATTTMFRAARPVMFQRFPAAGARLAGRRTAGRRFQSTSSSAEHPAAPQQPQSWFKRMWNSPIGLKTVHFW